MTQLAKAVGSHWFDIGVHLDFTFEELDEIKRGNDEYYRRLLQILRIWKGRQEGVARVKYLIDACREAGVSGAAMKVFL